MESGHPNGLLQAVLAHLAECVMVCELDARVTYANPATEHTFGHSLTAMAGRVLWEIFPEARDTGFHRAFERVADTGVAEVFDNHYRALDRWFTNRITRVGDQIHVFARDVSDDMRARRRIEAGVRIAEVLAADELPSGTTAIAEILTELLDADCSIALLSDDRQWLELVAVATRSPELRPITTGLARFPATSGHPGEALRTRGSVLANRAALAAETARIPDPATRAVVEQYQPFALIVVPLFGGEDPVGVLMVVRREPRALTEEDRALAVDIAASVGLYLAHARRRAEAATLEHQLAAVTDSNPALVSFVDRQARYLYVNASYSRWYGLPREHFLGKHIAEALGESIFEKIEPHIQRALAGEAVHYKTPLDYPTVTRHIDARYTPIRDKTGAVEGFAAVVADITVERRLEARLQSLLAVTGKLAGAADEGEIAQILVDEGITAIEASLSALWKLRGDGVLELVRERGFLPEHVRAFAEVPLSNSGPIAECVSNVVPIWVESRAQYAERYPQFEPAHRPNPAPPIAFAILPLVIEERVVGCVNFTFHDERRLTADDRAYLELLVSHVAQAMRRARLYAALRDVSEAREAMIQASPAAIMVLDDHAIVLAWNPAAERIFGWTEAEAIGRVLPMASTAEERVHQLARVREVLAGRAIHDARFRWARKSGELVDVELYAVQVPASDGRMRCLAMAFDISERVRVERGRELLATASATLSRSLQQDDIIERVLQLPLEHFADWCVVDMLGPGDLLRRHARGRAGILPDELVPKQMVHDPKYLGSSRAIAERGPSLLRDLDDATLRRIARDDSHLALIRSVGMRSGLSLPLLVGDRMLGALTLVSRTRNFDELDVELFGDLANRAAVAIENARLFDEAQQARRDAEAADRAKDQFLAMLGHELRNPLAPITAALHLMKMRAPNTNERERGVVERQVSHLSRLVDDLLDVSRITRGKVDLRRERVPVGAVIARAIEITSPLFEQRRHRLMLDMPQDLVIDGDPTRLDQVLANLMSNAAKYTDPGGQIEVRAVRVGNDVELSVIDNGVGIAVDMLPTIFDVFVQAPQPSARTQGGLGLGLAIVKSIVELHGGSVRARSDGPGRGTEMTVTLPAASAIEQTVALAPSLAPRRSGRRILVVDDNRDAANMLSEVLDSYSNIIRTAYDGPSALRLADELQPEVAILDIGLPVMDGYELAGRLRTTWPEIRLIAVTGYGQASDRERTRAAGFEAHVPKPVPIQTLIDLLDAEN